MHAVLRYVFGNATKHRIIRSDAAVLDAYSTAWLFDGWDVPLPKVRDKGHWPRPKPWTPLLARWWRTHGVLRITDAPGTKLRIRAQA